MHCKRPMPGICAGGFPICNYLKWLCERPGNTHDPKEIITNQKGDLSMKELWPDNAREEVF